MILDLLVEEQGLYERRSARAEIDGGLLGEIRPTFQGENVLLAIRDAGAVVGLCWCVIYDPGTGLEGEVAEVYVQPDHRGKGLARRLLAAAVELFAARGVTFASVWTHPENSAAIALYEGAGFSSSEQLVLTWLPEAG